MSGLTAFSSLLFVSVVSIASEFSDLFNLKLREVETNTWHRLTATTGEEALLQYYNEMAHRTDSCGNEHCMDSQTYTWRNPISFELTVSKEMQHRLYIADRAIQKFAAFSIKATSGALEFVSGEPNVLIYIGDAELKEAVESSLSPQEHSNFSALSEVAKEGCYASIMIVDDEIVKSVIFAPDHLMEVQLEKCLLEELYNSTGLFGDPIGYASVFDAFKEHSSYEFAPYTSEMFKLLKMHYELSID